MGARLRGGGVLSAKLRDAMRDASQAASEALAREGKALEARSRALAPVDSGDLEAAHSTAVRTTDSLTQVQVAVGSSEVTPYLAYTHEGSYQLGPESQAKAQATGAPVGPRYLARAFRERKKLIIASVVAAVRKALHRR